MFPSVGKPVWEWPGRKGTKLVLEQRADMCVPSLANIYRQQHICIVDLACVLLVT